MTTKTVNRPCPICNSNRAIFLTSIEYLYFEKTKLPSKYDIVSCDNCGFVFNDSSATQIDYDDYYMSSAKYNTKEISGAGGVSAMDRDRFQQLIDFLFSHIKISDTILDIGCAKGGLLRILKEQGFENLTGIDPSPYCVKLLEDSGLKGYVGNIFNIDPVINVDVILLTAVLEHIYDLKRAISVLSNAIKNNGLLFIEVPDSSRYKEFTDTPYYRFDMEHINHFSIEHLKNLLCQYGYELIAYKSIDVPVSKTKKAPSLLALFHKIESRGRIICPDFSLKKYIIEYVETSERNDKYPVIERLYETQAPFFIWGFGAHTSSLLKKTKLSKCNIKGFIDNDPNKRGKKILNRPILSSEYLNDLSEIVLICSVLYHDEMIESLKNIGYKGQIISLG